MLPRRGWRQDGMSPARSHRRTVLRSVPRSREIWRKETPVDVQANGLLEAGAPTRVRRWAARRRGRVRPLDCGRDRRGYASSLPAATSVAIRRTAA